MDNTQHDTLYTNIRRNTRRPAKWAASIASEYPLADFALFRPPARTVKITCWGAGLRWRAQSMKHFEALTAERQKARREEQDYAAVRRNVEEFLSPPRQVPARQKDMELECPLGQTFCRNLRFPLSFCRNVRYNEDINDFEGGEPHDKRRGIAALFYCSVYHIVACAVASILLC